MNAADRWADVLDLWPSRTEMVAGLLPTKARVLDLGCGAAGLRRYVRRYTPADIVQRSADCLVFDADAGVFPVGHWDVVTAIGLLEHIDAVAETLAAMRSLAPVAVVTYRPSQDGSITVERERAGWKNSLTTLGLERLAHHAGWRHTERRGRWHQQRIWRLR